MFSHCFAQLPGLLVQIQRDLFARNTADATVEKLERCKAHATTTDVLVLYEGYDVDEAEGQW